MQISELQPPLSQKQVAELAALFTEAFETPPSDSFIERLNEKQDLLVLVATVNSEVIGFKIGYTRFKAVFFSWLGAVACSKRRSGVARTLLRHQHKLCEERGYKELQTESAGSNQAMLILNLQEGFEISGVHLGRSDILTVQLRKYLPNAARH